MTLFGSEAVSNWQNHDATNHRQMMDVLMVIWKLLRCLWCIFKIRNADTVIRWYMYCTESTVQRADNCSGRFSTSTVQSPGTAKRQGMAISHFEVRRRGEFMLEGNSVNHEIANCLAGNDHFFSDFIDTSDVFLLAIFVAHRQILN